MFLTQKEQQTFEKHDYLLIWLDAFLLDRRACGVTPGTVKFYSEKMKLFTDYCETKALTLVTQITPSFIREYLIWLGDRHNAGGIHACYRVLKTFLFWWEDEVEPENWKNPIRKVKAPRIPNDPIEGVSLDTVMRLVDVCDRNFNGDRDTAILLCLFDTGARAREFLSVDLDDVNHATGEILIRSGKGRKPRYVYVGRKSRRALRRYLKSRRDDYPALWVTCAGRLKYSGLRSMITRRSKQAGIEAPAIHDFRRGFALAMLRNGTDIFSLAKLMGHEGITVLQRYLAQTDQDTKEAHRRASPIDNL